MTFKAQVGVFSVIMSPKAFDITRKFMSILVGVLVRHDELTLESIKQLLGSADVRSKKGVRKSKSDADVSSELRSSRRNTSRKRKKFICGIQ